MVGFVQDLPDQRLTHERIINPLVQSLCNKSPKLSVRNQIPVSYCNHPRTSQTGTLSRRNLTSNNPLHLLESYCQISARITCHCVMVMNVPRHRSSTSSFRNLTTIGDALFISCRAIIAKLGAIPPSSSSSLVVGRPTNSQQPKTSFVTPHVVKVRRPNCTFSHIFLRPDNGRQFPS